MFDVSYLLPESENDEETVPVAWRFSIMSPNNSRQRIRREETRYRGKGGSFVFQNEEHSAFLSDGNIVSRERRESPTLQGVVPHEPTDVAGQCQSCQSFATKDMLMVCDCCWQVVCLPCASQRQNLTVCPSCAQYLARRRWIQILRKLLIEPFVEWIG